MRKVVWSAVLLAFGAFALLMALSGGPKDTPGSPPWDASGQSGASPRRGQDPEVSPDPSMTYDVTVEVRGRRGDRLTPLAGAIVTVLPGLPFRSLADAEMLGGFHAETITDGDGRASPGPVKGGRWRVQVVAPGHFGSYQEFVAAGPGDRVVWTADLDACGRVHGGVVAPDGTVAAGTVVHVLTQGAANRELSDLHPDDRRPDRRVQQIASPEGRFDLPVLPVGADFTLLFDHGALGRREVPIAALGPGEAKEMTVRLDPHTNVRGSVQTSRRDGASVSIECWHMGDDLESATLLGEQRQILEEDGRFLLQNLSPGWKALVGVVQSADRIDVAAMQVLAPAGVTTDVGQIPVADSTLQVLVVVEGGLEAGRPVAIHMRLVENPGGVGGRYPVPFKVQPGEFEVRGLPAGMVMFEAAVQTPGTPFADPLWVEHHSRHTFDGRHGRVEIVVERTPPPTKGELAMVVVPPEGVDPGTFETHIVVLRGDEVVQTFPHRVPGCRSFATPNLPEGRYVVAAVVEGFRSDPVTVEIVRGKTCNLSLDRWRPALPLHGRVVDAQGVAVPQAKVAVLPAPAGSDASGRPILEVQADASGEFRTTAVPAVAGAVLVAWAPRGSSRPIPIDCSQPPSPATIVLEPKEGR